MKAVTAMKKSAPKQTASSQVLRVNEQKWTKELMAAGWTVVSNIIVERQQVLGLDAVDINILMHLALYWWTRDNKTHSAKTTIARAMHIHLRTVQRGIAAMESHGPIRREERRI